MKHHIIPSLIVIACIIFHKDISKTSLIIAKKIKISSFHFDNLEKDSEEQYNYRMEGEQRLREISTEISSEIKYLKLIQNHNNDKLINNTKPEVEIDELLEHYDHTIQDIKNKLSYLSKNSVSTKGMNEEDKADFIKILSSVEFAVTNLSSDIKFHMDFFTKSKEQIGKLAWRRDIVSLLRSQVLFLGSFIDNTFVEGSIITENQIKTYKGDDIVEFFNFKNLMIQEVINSPPIGNPEINTPKERVNMSSKHLSIDCAKRGTLCFTDKLYILEKDTVKQVVLKSLLLPKIQNPNAESRSTKPPPNS